MAKKKNNNANSNANANANAGDEVPVNGDEKKASGGGGGGGGGGKKDSPKEPSEVVLKTEIHCEGCASKLTKLSRSFSGVESAKADMGSGKLSVTGQVDPTELREFLALKTKKKVDIISPKKETNNNKNNNDKDKDKKKDEKKPVNDNDKKKPKEVMTAMIKMSLHCQGCIEKIHKIISKTPGVQEVSIDKQKEIVVVKGTMDVKVLVESLEERFKRNVEVVPPPKKDKEEGNNAGGSGGGKKKKGGGGGGGGEEKENGGENRMDFMMQPGFTPGYGFVGQPVNAPPGFMGQPLNASGFAGQPVNAPGFMGQPLNASGFVGQPVNAPGFVGQPVYGNGTVGQPIYGNGYMGQPIYGNGYMGQPDNGFGYGYQVPGYPAHMKFNDENPNACSVM